MVSMSMLQKPQNLFKPVKMQAGCHKRVICSAQLIAPDQIMDNTISNCQKNLFYKNCHLNLFFSIQLDPFFHHNV